MTDETISPLPEPAWPISISRELWEAFAVEFAPEFADSWLYGARTIGDSLLPRTRTAYFKLKGMNHRPRKDHPPIGVAKILNDFGLKLMNPPPFHESSQLSAMEEMPELYLDQNPKGSAR